jgi:hypothetical protein
MISCSLDGNTILHYEGISPYSDEVALAYRYGFGRLRSQVSMNYVLHTLLFHGFLSAVCPCSRFHHGPGSVDDRP